MVQIAEGSLDAQNSAKTLIDVIVGEVMKAVNKRTEPNVDSFESLKIQSLGNEGIILACIKSEGMSLEEVKQGENQGKVSANDICYQNMADDGTQSSKISTQGEGDFQPPFVRKAKAFYHLEADIAEGNDASSTELSRSPRETSFTDELIAQVHCNINNISFDNVNLSDSEMERELQTKESGFDEDSLSQDGEERKSQINQCCQTNCTINYEEDMEYLLEQNYHELRHSPKFSNLDYIDHEYTRLKQNHDERKYDEERELLSTSSEEVICAKSKDEAGSADKFSQTNPFRNPYYCSNVNSTIAMSSDSCETDAAESSRPTIFVGQENQESNEWVEANEVEIKITEPGCSKDFLPMENPEELFQTRQYWSNVGLITEHIVDRKYIGPLEIPGIESIKGVRRVEEKYLTHEPEEIIWVSEAEPLEENESPSASQGAPKDENLNYLSFPEKNESKEKKKGFVSRLTKAISSVFKFNSKESLKNN